MISVAFARSKHTYYSLQVGAYPTEKITKQKIANFPIKDPDIHYRLVTVNGKNVYRLLIGKFSTEKEAENFKALFKTQTQINDSFIRKIEE